MSRIERTVFGDWWRTVDRLMLSALVALMVAGLVLLMAGGPPVAERLGLSTFHFTSRQFFYLLRRLALVTYAVGMVLVVLAIQFGPEIKGAHRWIGIGPFGLQPSEFVKPAFVIIAAWAFAEGSRRKDMPGALLALLLLPATIIPLILQPDFGQTMLITIVWCGLFFVAGLHWFWVLGLGGAGLIGIVAAYEFLPHVRARIGRFMDKSSGDTFPVDTAMESFAKGGWLGRGPGEGTVKRILPDAHTDFIVLRGLMLARRSEDAFCRLAITGLVLMFGLQAAINMMVNVHLMPAKGMTLPFISYGGSSLLSLALGMGFLVALTRPPPRAGMMENFPQGW